MNLLFLEGDMSRGGGTERMAALLSNALCEEHNVWIVSRRFDRDSLFFELGSAVRHEILVKKNEECGLISQVLSIRKLIKKYEIDWVINVDVGMAIYGIPAIWGTGARVITWEHSNYYNNWNSRVFPYFRRFAAKFSDIMVVLTEKDKRNYQENIKSNKPIYVIPNPVSRHKFKYDVQSKIILTAGLLLPIKGYDFVIKAAQRLLPLHKDWKWMICGEGPERERLENMIREAGLQNQVMLVGTVKDMDEQYSQAAMYVMTSKMEGLPMVLLEAKSWGLPIVSFDLMTGPSDIVRDGVNGFLVEPNNVTELTEKIERLVASDELREEFSENSQLDMEKFDFDSIVNRWKEVMNL